MAKRDKTLQKWRKATEEDWDTVKSVLAHAGFVKKGSDNGSHSTWLHPTLQLAIKNYREFFVRDYGPDGGIVVIRQGNKVIGHYLKRILKAIEDIEGIESFEAKRRTGERS